MRQDSLPTDLMYIALAGTQLTRRERQVLRCAARGMTKQQTADLLGIGYETVKSEVRIARGRLHAKNVAHAVAIAVSLDLI